MSTRKRPRRRSTRDLSLSRRAKIVWLALLGAMTGVGGLLLAADGRPAPRVDGLAVPPLMASGMPSSIETVLRTRKPAEKNRWQAIVIHHTAQPFGSPASISDEHEKLGFRGLGHHFVIGNGAGMDDGELHVGFRWLDQLPGAHAGGERGDWYNQHAISICLVGNGDRKAFTKAQLARLDQLITLLRREFNLPADRVVLHSQIAPTSDPGVLFPATWLRQRLTDGN
jgi:N-acetyl-anhydromuramyl-L-alanine amidase AmpD